MCISCETPGTDASQPTAPSGPRAVDPTFAMSLLGTQLRAGLESIADAVVTVATALAPPPDQKDAVVAFLDRVNPDVVGQIALEDASLDLSPAAAIIAVLRRQAAGQ